MHLYYISQSSCYATIVLFIIRSQMKVKVTNIPMTHFCTVTLRLQTTKPWDDTGNPPLVSLSGQFLRDLALPLRSVMTPPSSSYPSILRNFRISCLYLPDRGQKTGKLECHDNLYSKRQNRDECLDKTNTGTKGCFYNLIAFKCTECHQYNSPNYLTMHL